MATSAFKHTEISTDLLSVYHGSDICIRIVNKAHESFMNISYHFCEECLCGTQDMRYNRCIFLYVIFLSRDFVLSVYVYYDGYLSLVQVTLVQPLLLKYLYT